VLGLIDSLRTARRPDLPALCVQLFRRLLASVARAWRARRRGPAGSSRPSWRRWGTTCRTSTTATARPAGLGDAVPLPVLQVRAVRLRVRASGERDRAPLGVPMAETSSTPPPRCWREFVLPDQYGSGVAPPQRPPRRRRPRPPPPHSPCPWASCRAPAAPSRCPRRALPRRPRGGEKDRGPPAAPPAAAAAAPAAAGASGLPARSPSASRLREAGSSVGGGAAAAGSATAAASSGAISERLSSAIR